MSPITSRRRKFVGRALGALALLLLFCGASEAQSVTLAWNANTESDLAGYVVYYGTSSGSYSNNIPVGNVTTFTVIGLTPGQPYFFAIKAINLSGAQSAFSNEVTSASPNSAQLTTPTPGSTLTGSTATFLWTAGTGVASYQLSVGTTPGGGELFDQVLPGLSQLVTGLPTNGSPVYVRLWSLIGSAWFFRDYTYTAFSNALTINNVSVTEGNSGTTTATFTVTLTPVSTQTVTVAYATANGTATTADNDYVAKSGTLTFAAGVTTQTIAVTVNGDTTVEPDQTFNVNLSSATNATITDALGVGTIVNDDAVQPALSINNVSVTEGNSGTTTATFTVTMTPTSTQTVTVAYATADGTATTANGDYVAKSGTLTFAPGATTQTIAVTVNGDTTIEVDQTFNVNLSGPTNATISDALGVGTIVNDDFALSALSINNVGVTEGNSGTTTATFTVTLTPTSPQTVTVAYATADGTATTANSDYVGKSGTLTFPVGVITQTIVVTINGDTAVEPDETFVVNLTSPTNATISDAQGVGTILNNDIPPPTVTVSPATVNPGDVITATVANGPGNPTDWATFGLVTAADPGYVSWKYLNGLTTPPATGLTGATLQFTAPTAPGTYHVRWFANGTYTRLATSGTVTVLAQPTLSINNASVTEGNSGTVTANFTVTLTPTSTQTVTVAYATADGPATAGSDYVAKSGTLTFAPGVSTQPITVTVNGDTTAEPDEAFVVNLNSPTNAGIGDAQGSGTIVNDDAAPVPTVTALPASVNPGDVITVSVANGPGNVSDWVTLGLVAAPDSGYVAWKYLNGLAVPPATGMTSATMQFTAPTAPGTYHIRWFANGVYTRIATSGTVTVQATPALTINNASVTEGNSGTTTTTLNVTLTPTSTQTVTVAYATGDGTATAGSDYVAKSGTLTFAPGVSTQPITVTVNGDTTAEGDETFVVTLSGATNAMIGHAQGVATIANDDAAPGPTVTVSPATVNPGGVITATVANGPGNVSDWVTLGLVAAPDSGYVAWKYLNGLTTPPGIGLTNATVQFTAPTAPGTYHVRWFANGAYTRLGTSSTVTVQAQPALTINNASVTEGNSGTTTATFTVTLTPTSTQTVTVAYATADGPATAGSDYVANSGTLTFPAGVSTQTIAVTVNGDTTAEPDETFVVNLSSATNATIGDAQGVGTIVNDDAVPSGLGINNVGVTEGNSGTATATFTVTLTPASTQTVTVAYSTADGTATTANSDYVAKSGTLTFSAGTTTQTVTVTVNGDTTLESDETFVVNLSSPTNATITDAQGVGTIVNDDSAPSALGINNVGVTEGNSGTTTATFTVTLTPASTQSVTVAYATAEVTATAGSDYVSKSGTLTFAPGATTQTIAVTVNGDTTLEADETFAMNLSSPTNATISDAQGMATIVNDDAAAGPTIIASPTSVSPGDVITATVLNGPGNAMDWVTIGMVSAPDTGYVTWKYLNGLNTPPGAGLTSATLTFTAPTTPGTYELRFFVNNSWTRLATSGPVTVQAALPTPTLTINNASVTEGNSGTVLATFTVTLSPTSTQTVTVAYATADGTATAGSDYVAKSGTLTFAPGVSTQSITVTVNGDTTPESDESFVVNLSSAANATIGDAQGGATIVNDDAATGPMVTVLSTSVNPGGVITATVINGPGNTMDWVTLSSTAAGDPGYISWKFLNNTTVAPLTGLTGGTVTFVAPTTPGTYNVRFFANNTYVKLATSATVTVVGAVTSLTVSPTTVSPGAQITVTVANGPGAIADWVAMSPTGAPDSSYVAWEYLSGTTLLPPTGLTNATLQFTAPSTPGTYNFRFYANNTYTKLATSATVTVQ